MLTLDCWLPTIEYDIQNVFGLNDVISTINSHQMFCLFLIVNFIVYLFTWLYDIFLANSFWNFKCTSNGDNSWWIVSNWVRCDLVFEISVWAFALWFLLFSIWIYWKLFFLRQPIWKHFIITCFSFLFRQCFVCF